MLRVHGGASVGCKRTTANGVKAVQGPIASPQLRACSSNYARAFSVAVQRVGRFPAAEQCVGVHVASQRAGVQAKATKQEIGSTEPNFVPKTAREAVEVATRIQKEKKDYAEAVRLYLVAMDMQPNDDEARAALYNMGCALAKQKQWTPATECIMRAINDYSLKLAVALKDDDLIELRERREWLDALMEMKGGLSRAAKIDLRAEAKAPFRFPRIVLFGGLAIGAAVGLFIITLRIIKAVQGGDDAPELTETLQNFGINSAAFVILSWLVWRDVKSKEKSLKITDREEALGRLQIDLGGSRQLPLLRLRGQVRPVILSGSKAFIETAIREADPYYQKLRDRGVSVVPVPLDEVETARRAKALAASALDPDAKIKALKKEFQAERDKGAKGFGGKAEEEPAAKAVADDQPAYSFRETDKKWRLVPYQIIEWKDWIDNQKEFASMGDMSRDLYIQVQLDGTVRSSGTGIPNWSKLVDDLPPLDSVRTTLMDGVGPSEV